MNIRQKKKRKKKKNKAENGMGISKVSVGNTKIIDFFFFYLSGKITPNNGVFSLQKPLTCTLC